MMKIKDIIKGINVLSSSGDVNALASDIVFDSRQVTESSMFVAVKGSRTDGHDYIGSVIDAGAIAIICEVLPENPDSRVCWIKTGDSAKALGIAASNFYGRPSESLKLVGVTGTN
jgi:UDP-N-acetylmuramoyl-L-alanyl-D-glutamate--2,6-diaminopimelate ligase